MLNGASSSQSGNMASNKLQMAANSPTSIKNALVQEPLFGTPLSFAQRMAAEQMKSSPLRVELLKERFLGTVEIGSSVSGKDPKEGSSVDPGSLSTKSHSLMVASEDGLSVLQAEFEQRNLLRQDILADAKMSRERARQYLTHVSNITGNDSTAHQQIVLLRSIHAEELGEQRQLIAQMTAVIRDLEQQNERLRGLRRGRAQDTSPATQVLAPSSPGGNTPTAVVRSNVRGLVDQIERLQSEKAILNDELLTLRSSAAKNWLAEFDLLRGLNTELEKQKKKLEDELCQLRLSAANESLSAEKRIHVMEGQMEKLSHDLNKLISQSQSEKLCDDHETNTSWSGNRRNSDMLLELENLRKESVNLRVQLVAAKAKSPEVVTKIRHLGELNLNNQEELARAKSQITQSRIELDCVRQELQAREDNSKSLVEVKDQQVRDLEVQLNCSRQQLKELRERCLHSAIVRPPVNELMSALDQLRNEFGSLKDATVSSLKSAADDITAKVFGISQQCQELRSKYRRELELRKKYHNELVELKGNIRVLCRVRPTILEDGSSASTVVSFDREDDSLVYIERNKQKLSFECDHVFKTESSQEQVFVEVQQFVTSCVDGYNVCIFAYGQTGSGKTYTMEGTKENVGICRRTLVSLFGEINGRRPEWTYELQVSALEIYNENIKSTEDVGQYRVQRTRCGNDNLNRDLSSDGDYEEVLDIKMAQDGSVYVPGLTWRRVDTADDINKILTLVSKKRVTAATSMNDRSSRSHAIIGITVTGTNAANTKVIGRLNLVDLAGSERVSKSGAEGERLKEAQYINRSLLSLGDVIHALQTRQAHVPYRNSRLTYLLQDCLGGESKTLMLMNISPVEKNVSESCATLSFAQRVMSVELGPARKRTLAASVDGNTEVKTPSKGGPTPSKIARKK